MWDMVNFPEVDNAIGVDNFDNYWEFRRIRIFLSGSGYGMYEYKLQLDFEPEGNDTDDKDSGVSIKDLYVGLTDVCFFQHIRFGHFKEAHGLENLTSSKYITFMERYAATKVFAPERNVGIQSYMCSCDSSMGLQYGAFLPRSFDDVDETDHERISDHQGLDLVARAFASPYYCGDGRHLVHVGAGAWYSHLARREDANLAVMRDRIRPGTHEGGRIINATTLDGNDVNDFFTFNLEAAAVWGPLSVQGEFFAKYFDTNNIGNQNYYGAYAFVSYFLTGENRVYDRCTGDFGRVKPHTNFWAVPTCGDHCCMGSGAWELAARWQYYNNDDDPTAFAGEANAYTLGVNWYLNPYVRTMFNYEHWDADYNNGQNGQVDWVGCRVQWDF
jgi:phosphate-selective porin OprO/OprP